MARFDSLHFRRFMLDIFRKLEFQDFFKLEEVVKSSRLSIVIGIQFSYDLNENKHKSLHKWVSLLTNGQYVKADNVKLLYLLFTYIRRVDLLKDIRDYEAKFVKRKKDKEHNKKHPWMLTKRETCAYIFSFILIFAATMVLLTNIYEIQRVLAFITDSFFLKILLLSVLVGLVIFNQQIKDLWDTVCCWQCTRGCVTGSELYFEFERGNKQKIIVENNKEFPFQLLQNKFPHLRKHPDKTMLYFMNTNLYMNGGIATNGSYIDHQKEIRGAEAFSMDPAATSVWYFHGQHEGWMKYETAANIRWKTLFNA